MHSSQLDTQVPLKLITGSNNDEEEQILHQSAPLQSLLSLHMILCLLT